MNKEQLEIAKKIAEIEGVNLTLEVSSCPDTGEAAEWYSYLPHKQAFCSEIYNPFSWEILGPLMVKYNVLRPTSSYVSIGSCMEYMHDSLYDMPMAILKCIIKSQEK